MTGLSESDEANEILPNGEAETEDVSAADGPVVAELVDSSEVEELKAALHASKAARDAAEARLRTVSSAYKQLEEDKRAFQERVARQQELKLEVYKGDTVSRLFAPFENLKRSVEEIEKAEVDEGLTEGLRLVCRSFHEAFTRMGLEEVPGQGSLFDPNLHEALTVVPTPNPALDGRVLEVFSGGYRVGNRLIRAAKVVVAQAPEIPPGQDDATGEAVGEE